MDIANIIQTVAIYAIPVIFAITLHEAAHGYAAKKLGDNTAYALGRVTLNPIKHIDPMGTIAVPLLLYFATAGTFLFGYAKPVPVRFGNLRRPKKDMIWVALAGPGFQFSSGHFLGHHVLALGQGIAHRAFLFRNVSGGGIGQRGDVCLQFISSSTPRWWTYFGRRVTLETSSHGFKG